MGTRDVAIFRTEGSAAGKFKKFDVALVYLERAISKKLALIYSLLLTQMISYFIASIFTLLVSFFFSIT